MAKMPDIEVRVELDEDVFEKFHKEIYESERRVVLLFMRKQEKINKEFLRRQRNHVYKTIALTAFAMSLFFLFVLWRLL